VKRHCEAQVTDPLVALRQELVILGFDSDPVDQRLDLVYRVRRRHSGDVGKRQLPTRHLAVRRRILDLDDRRQGRRREGGGLGDRFPGRFVGRRDGLVDIQRIEHARDHVTAV
jgi:hypothetical protein